MAALRREAMFVATGARLYDRRVVLIKVQPKRSCSRIRSMISVKGPVAGVSVAWRHRYRRRFRMPQHRPHHLALQWRTDLFASRWLRPFNMEIVQPTARRYQGHGLSPRPGRPSCKKDLEDYEIVRVLLRSRLGNPAASVVQFVTRRWVVEYAPSPWLNRSLAGLGTQVDARCLGQRNLICERSSVTSSDVLASIRTHASENSVILT